MVETTNRGCKHIKTNLMYKCTFAYTNAALVAKVPNQNSNLNFIYLFLPHVFIIKGSRYLRAVGRSIGRVHS